MKTIKRKTNTDRPLWGEGYLIVSLIAYLGGCVAFLLIRPRLGSLPSILSWMEAAVFGALAAFLFLGMIRKQRAYLWWETALILLSLAGIWIASVALLPIWLAILLAACLTVIPYLFPTVLWQNMSYLVGSVGIGLVLARHFPASVILTVSLSAVMYEYIRERVWQMPSLMADAWKAGLPPGVLLPSKWSGWRQQITEVWRPGEGLIVGLLPFMILAALGSTLTAGGWGFVTVGLFALVGIGWLFGRTDSGKVRRWVFLASVTGVYIGAVILYRLLV